MSERFQVRIADFLTSDDMERELNVLGDIADIEPLDGKVEDDLIGRIEDSDAIIIFHQLKITRRTLERLTRCKLIVRCGVGVDNVDHQLAGQLGIPVANVPDYGTEDVADYAIGMMLSMTRGISILNSRLRRQGGLWTHSHAIPLRRIRGSVLGIVGLGRIGTAVALRAKSMGMDVVFYDPYRADGYDKALGIRRAESLEELCQQSYVVSVHCPLTDETHHMINQQSLRYFPPGSYLVNTARGAVVDTAAIPPAIESGQLAGAAIDVLTAEPPSDDDPLIVAWRDPTHAAHERVLITPHAAWYSQQGFDDMRIKAAQSCRRALLGQPMRNVINSGNLVFS